MQECCHCSGDMVLCPICQIVDTCSTRCDYQAFGRERACRKCYKDKARLFEACRGGEIDVIDEILGHIDPRRVDEKHQNLLLVACETYQPWVRDVVQRLLQAGADVDFPNNGYKALQMVLMWPEFDIPSLPCCFILAN